MTDLVEWLLQQIDHDEQLAALASPGPWKPNPEGDEVWAADDIPVAEGFALSGGQLRNTVSHITNYDPARVQAETAAKRHIIELHSHAQGSREPGWPCETLRHLAIPYAGRSGYQPEWAPHIPD